MELINEIWATARRNKLRTALTGFAVAWGIFMIIFLLGAGNGLINAMMYNTGRFLDTSMMVGGGNTSKPYDGLQEGRSITLDDRDISATASDFAKHVDKVGAEIEQRGLTMTHGANYVSGTLSGVYPNDIEINKKDMLCGRFINNLDLAGQRKTVVLSEDNARQLIGSDTGVSGSDAGASGSNTGASGSDAGGSGSDAGSPKYYNVASLVGGYVDIAGVAFRVVGIYKTQQDRMDNSAYTAFSTLRTIYGRGNKADNIVFSFHGLDTEEQNEAFERAYTARINRNHRAAPDDDNAIWIWNRFTQAQQMNTGVGIIHTALWVIGLFTLLSGIVGVSNIMLITVKERTREFGIRKAIGASPMSILRLIIVESVVITTFFGYIGMLCGIAANAYMDATIGHTVVDSGLFQATMFVNPTVGPDVCLGATAVMIVAGTFAGLLPARKAAKIRPIEALRAE